MRVIDMDYGSAHLRSAVRAQAAMLAKALVARQQLINQNIALEAEVAALKADRDNHAAEIAALKADRDSLKTDRDKHDGELAALDARVAQLESDKPTP